MLLRIFQPRQHRPHRRHLQRVRRDVFAADLARVVVLRVDALLLGDARDVRDVDLHRTVAQRLHELVGQQLLVFGLVGVAEDHLVDVRLRELLRLDLVLLRRAQQVVEERDVQLQHLDELDDAAVGDVELAVEVERARIAVRPELGDLAVVDVAGQLGRVLVLLVLGLERADADAVLLGQDQAPHAHVFDHLRPVAFVLGQQLAEDQPARGIQIAFDVDVRLARDVDPQLGERALAPLGRDQAQRLLVHRALERRRPAGHARQLLGQHPVVGVERAFRRARVLLHAALDEARDRRLRAADRAVQQDHAALGAVALGRAVQHADQPHERDVEPEDRVAAAVLLVLEEVVADQPLLVVDVLFLAVRQDHVVDALEGEARDGRVLADDGQVVLERAGPVQLRVFLQILKRCNLRDQGGHVACLAGRIRNGHRVDSFRTRDWHCGPDGGPWERLPSL